MSIAAGAAPIAADGTRQAAPLVLVAEDNAVNQAVARGMLEKLGYAVDVVGDGQHAVEAARRTDDAAILLDRRAGQSDPVPRLVDLFIKETEARLTLLRDAVVRRDLPETHRLAHAQKGAAARLAPTKCGASPRSSNRSRGRETTTPSMS